ncbi:MAG: excinuclease ABC subunit UvrC [Alphaproteobacteria bacterium]|nr:excinuclease ABC subunit UvrC [Alphaproteobacteria bacterium]
MTSFLRGAELIKKRLPSLPMLPGVYRMLDKDGRVLYVGKAKNLRKRVTNYTQFERLSARIQLMVSLTEDLIVITTNSEAEAFLLENDLIKNLKPHFNILLRDDKTFPHILITEDEEWPQILKHRGTKKRKGTYFGPFASVLAVNQTLKILQKAFLLRSCSDAVFASRIRPCLLYQIKQCSGPCAGKISFDDYAKTVTEAKAFMKGKSSEIQHELGKEMARLSAEQKYEEAAVIRDRIKALNLVQSHAVIDIATEAAIDIIAAYIEGDMACVQVFFIRSGFNCGNHAYFHIGTEGLGEADIIEAFIGQFYQTHDKPEEIVVSHKLTGEKEIAEALNVKINDNPKSVRKRLLENALLNAKEALARHKIEKAADDRIHGELAELIGLKTPLQRIEVYDNSHIQGTNAVGAMIVASPEGFKKSAYRRFNISGEDVTPGDDYGMMREVLTRRLSRGLKEGDLPDLIIVDGGKGQMSIAAEVFSALEVDTDKVKLLGVAKGENRNAGDETLILASGERVKLPLDSPLLFYIQRLRDEAHRFAIGSHRNRREKAMFTNRLDDIPGIGAKRKKALLEHFGSARAAAEASLNELLTVEGISENIAKKVYTYFHPYA